MTRSLRGFLGWVGIAAAFGFSLAPATDGSPVFSYADKLVHLAGYAMLMYWWAQLYTASQQRIPLAAALVLLGIVIEWLQGFTPTRESDAWDVLANTTGIILGGWIAYRSDNLLNVYSRYALKTHTK